MTDLLIALALLAAAAVPLWLLRDLRRVPASAIPPADGSRVSVVVPARDEEQTLPGLLASLRALADPDVVGEVVVVDDASRDRTAAVAQEAGARVVPAGAPPDGWTGKAWACHTGSGATTGDLLLFLDADTVLAPDALDGLLQLHTDRGGLVSVQPFHRVVRPYEQLSAYFNVVALMASDAFAGRAAATPMAFGPCLLTSRTDYDRVGGHEVVRSAILDDVRLAEAYARAGLPVTCAVGGRSVSMRSYPGGLSQLVSGWTKNIASGASAAGTHASLATVLWICAHHAVAVGTLLAVADALVGLGDGWTVGSPLLWAAAWFGFALQLRGILHSAGSFRWWAWALFPLPLLAFDLVFARSAVLTLVRRSVRWRGRPVDLRRERSTEEVG